MKKLNILISSLLTASLLVAGGAVAGCKKHKHSYESGWTSIDETYHWHAPTCDDTNEGSEKTEHNFNGGYKCVDCGYERAINGLSIKKTETQYELKDSLTANIQLNDIEVNIIDESGEETPLASSEYSLKYYKGDKEVTDLTEATSGTYNIWASATVKGELRETFVVVYVIDNVVKFERADGVDRSQDLGLDIISKTWNFNVTYSSGAKKTVNVSDEHIVRANFTTFVANDNGNATVIYSETNCIGETTSLSVRVPYTISTNPNSNVIYNKYSFDALKATLPASGDSGQGAGRVALTQSNFTGDNAFITLIGSADYRGPTNNVLEIKGDSLTVTFNGVGVLTIGARSTSNGDYSTIALRDSNGDYILATYPATNNNVGKDDDYNIYTVTGQSENLLSFEIEEPGTYTICTLTEANVDGSTIDTNRYTRIMTLEMTDILTKGDE